MSDDDITRLRTELAGMDGPARLPLLAQLGQALAMRFWRAGPGTPAGRPDLDGAVDALREAYSLQFEDDPMRGHVAGLLGMLLGTRHTVYQSEAGDRDDAVPLLEEALVASGLPPTQQATYRFILAQLLLARTLGLLRNPGDLMGLMSGGAPPKSRADVTRSVRLLREVIEESNAETITEAASAMLTTAEAVQMLFAGQQGGMDLGRLMEAMQKIQAIQNRVMRRDTPGPAGGFFPFANFNEILTVVPLDRPVEVINQPPPTPTTVPTPAAASVAPTTEPTVSPTPVAAEDEIDVVKLRARLHATLIPPGSTGSTGPVWDVAAALLLPSAPTLPVERIDDLVALSRTIVDTEGNAARASADIEGVDWFILAVALEHRDRLDDYGDHSDLVEGAESLLAAVRRTPRDHPGAVAMLRALGAFLLPERPFGGVSEQAAEVFAGRIDEVLAAGTVSDAVDRAGLETLRRLCGAVLALAELDRAAAAVSTYDPWLPRLKAAAAARG